MRIKYNLSYAPSKPSKNTLSGGVVIAHRNENTVWLQTDRYRGKKSFLFLKAKVTLSDNTLIFDCDNFGLFALLISIILAINGIIFLNDGEWINGLWVTLPVLFVSFFIYKARLHSLIERNLSLLYHTIKTPPYKSS